MWILYEKGSHESYYHANTEKRSPPGNPRRNSRLGRTIPNQPAAPATPGSPVVDLQYKKREASLLLLYGFRQRPTLPGRVQPSTIGAEGLNFCVRYGNLSLIHIYKAQEFWADRDISFTVEKGDMLGIIGTNGAGKSTLLKAISGIMLPTEGSIEAHGKVAALLELTSGFDADLTVRENTYLRGALLGYSRKFMHEMYDQIIDFAELDVYKRQDQRT